MFLNMKLTSNRYETNVKQIVGELLWYNQNEALSDMLLEKNNRVSKSDSSDFVKKHNTQSGLYPYVILSAVI